MESDESLYLEATNEFESNDRDPALWAKYMSICEGDEQKAKYKYINERVKLLSKNNKEHASQQAQRVREQKGFIENLSSGNYSLARTYWLYGAVVLFLIGIPIRFITSTNLLYTYCFVATLYQIAVLFGVWRSAVKYNGARVWAVLAKLATVIGWLSLIAVWLALIAN